MEQRTYEEELANGDPVIAYVDGECVSLGTGFKSWEDCFHSVEYTMKTGTSAWNIPEEASSVLEGANRVTLFTPGADLFPER